MAAGLQSPWVSKGDSGVPTPSTDGDSIISRGTDPNINLGGDGALQSVWSGAVVPVPGGEETGNSVSGLPLQPNRFEPSGEPPSPPDLTTRNPVTVDRR